MAAQHAAAPDDRPESQTAVGVLMIGAIEPLRDCRNMVTGGSPQSSLANGYVPRIADINSRSGIHCDHQQTLTASGILSYLLLDRTTFTGQVLFASGLRTAEEGAKTNSSHSPTYTIYNFSISHVIPLPWHGQKFVVGFDIVNALDQKYFLNQGEGSIGPGVSHAGMPRSFFFRGQWFF